MKTNETSNSSLKPKNTTDNPSLKATLCLVFVVRKLRSTRKKKGLSDVGCAFFRHLLETQWVEILFKEAIFHFLNFHIS